MNFFPKTFYNESNKTERLGWSSIRRHDPIGRFSAFYTKDPRLTEGSMAFSMPKNPGTWNISSILRRRNGTITIWFLPL
jgi:hypothetical protein